eukprot:14840965-Alexandrium_andersonii.AAC.1
MSTCQSDRTHGSPPAGRQLVEGLSAPPSSGLSLTVGRLGHSSRANNYRHSYAQGRSSTR